MKAALALTTFLGTALIMGLGRSEIRSIRGSGTISSNSLSSGAVSGSWIDSYSGSESGFGSSTMAS